MELFSNEVVGSTIRVNLLSAWYEVDEFGVPISYQMEGIVRAAVDNYRWKPKDEVDCYDLGWTVWDLVWLQESWQLCMGTLAMLQVWT